MYNFNKKKFYFITYKTYSVFKIIKNISSCQIQKYIRLKDLLKKSKIKKKTLINNSKTKNTSPVLKLPKNAYLLLLKYPVKKINKLVKKPNINIKIKLYSISKKNKFFPQNTFNQNK